LTASTNPLNLDDVTGELIPGRRRHVLSDIVKDLLGRIVERHILHQPTVHANQMVMMAGEPLGQLESGDPIRVVMFAQNTRLIEHR
jgi:hypothetical protein